MTGVLAFTRLLDETAGGETETQDTYTAADV